MDATVLHNLDFQLDLPLLLKKASIPEGSRHEGLVRELAEEARVFGRPKAIYKVAFIEEKGQDFVLAGGTRFSSRVLRVNLEIANRLFVYVCTAGRELETWATGKADLLENFLADAANELVLHGALATFRTHLTDRFHLEQTATMNPGSLADWPLAEQRPLFALLGDTEETIGVELTPRLLMKPVKTASGIMFPTEESFASCQLCANPGCPNRRAPYDPNLYDRKYRATAD